MSREMKDSGIDWIGRIPENWVCCKQKHVMTMINGRAYKDSEFENNGKYRILRVGNVYSNPVWYSSSLELPDDKYCNDGDLLYTWSMSYGPVIWRGEKVIYHYHIWKVALDPSLDKMFAYYYLSALTEAIMREVHETTMGFVTMNSMNNAYIAYPDIIEQKIVAECLDSKCSIIDSAISKHHQIIEKLEEYRKAVITQAVTKGLNQNVEMKYSCIPWVTSIPEKWSEQPLKLLFSNRKNKNTDCAETNLLSLSYGRIIRKDINSNEGLLPENFSGYNIIEPNDIVLRLTDLQNDHRSLRTGLVTEHGIITSAYVTLCPKANINSEYYHYLLHAYDVQKVFYTLGEGIRQSLKYEDLGKVLVPVPPRVEQDEIVHYLNAMSKMVDDVIDKHNQLISKLQEYKQSLIYNAVTGKIDCTTEA